MTPPPKPTSLEMLYAQAQEDPFYLANPQLLDTVCFDTGVKGEHLVIKSTIDNEVPTPASVTFFGEVSRSFCQVSPYGSYNPERNPFNDDVTKAKIKMQIRRVTNPRFKHLFENDWDKYLDAVTAIHHLAYDDSDLPQELGTPIKENEIAIQHSIFSVSHSVCHVKPLSLSYR